MHVSKWATYPAVAVLLVLLSACASLHRAAVEDGSSDRVSVGTVQKEIHVGMSSAEVAQVLGSPNIVSTDSQRREVWVYDRLATVTVRSRSKGGAKGGILGTFSRAIYVVLPFYYQDADATSRSQRTLTVIIKFDEQDFVRNFAYHTSRF